MNDVCFQLKGSVVSVLVLEFQDFSESNFVKQLKQKIAQAPRLLHQSPVVLSVEKLDETAADIDFSLVADHCRTLGLQPVGIKGEGPHVVEAARRSGLALLPRTAAEPSERRTAPSLADGTDYKRGDPESRPPESRPSKLITQPVRSGQQVYAQGADLVVVSQVSEGAEVLADGHIHVYGPLRGRALAGIQGDESARIFCRSLEAELLSIAGQFLLSDGVPEALWKQPAQVYFDGTTLVVQPL